MEPSARVFVFQSCVLAEGMLEKLELDNEGK